MKMDEPSTAGKDYHIPIVPALIKEEIAISLAKAGKGKLVCSRVNYFGSKTFVIIYLDYEAGPFEVVPLRSVGVRTLKSLGYIDNFWNRHDLGDPEIVPIEQVTSITTKIPDHWIEADKSRHNK